MGEGSADAPSLFALASSGPPTEPEPAHSRPIQETRFSSVAAAPYLDDDK